MNLLDAWAVCFLKGKPPEFVRFFNEINIFAILCCDEVEFYIPVFVWFICT